MLKKFTRDNGIRQYMNLIDNHWISSKSSKNYEILNPANNQLVGLTEETS
jgi:hypothetical protein